MANNVLRPWIIWFFPLSFFAFQFILRLFPGLVMPEFFAKYNIGATEFGLFASLYYLGYAGMQIPMAILLDRYGPRTVIGLSALLCGLACWLTVSNDSWHAALFSRFLIGVGSVVGFLGTSTVISLWFPKNRYARMVGLTFSFGLLGALYGGRPISMLIEGLSWQSVLNGLGMVSILIALLVFVFVRDKKVVHETQIPVIKALKQLLSKKSIWVLALANLLMVGTLEGFADVWGVSYLMNAHHLSKDTAASVVSFIFVGMLFGGPILAYMAEKWNAHYGITIMCGVLMAILLGGFILYIDHLSILAMGAILFVMGLLCCYQVIIFAIGCDAVPVALMSITVAFLNCINMLGGSFFHSSIGYLMDYLNVDTLSESATVYSVESYTWALMLIPACSLLGGYLVWLSKKLNSASVSNNEYSGVVGK